MHPRGLSYLHYLCYLCLLQHEKGKKDLKGLHFQINTLQGVLDGAINFILSGQKSQLLFYHIIKTSVILVS